MAVYILETHGKEKLALLLREYDLGKDHDEVFLSVFNQSLDDFEMGWETWVRSEFTIAAPPTLTSMPPATQKAPASSPNRNLLALLVLLCCFSVSGVTGLCFIFLLWRSTVKKTAP